MKRGLCISGGGAYGAYGGGVAQKLAQNGTKWQTIIGTSTGSLLAPLIALDDFKRLREFYTSVTQKDIFTVNPFLKNGKLNIWRAIWRVLCGKNTLGDSSNLRDLIEKCFTKQDYDILSDQEDIEVIVTVVNATKKRIEYKNLHSCWYDDFCDWIYASACVPILMSEFKKDGCIYWDGGVMEHTPLNKALAMGCDKVDVIIHREELPNITNWQPKNIFSGFSQVIDCMQLEIAKSDITLAEYELDAMQYPALAKIKTYYLPKKLGNNSLLFDKQKMNEWWELGMGI